MMEAGSTDGRGEPPSYDMLEQYAKKKKREVEELKKALRKKKKNERKVKEEIETSKLKMYDQAKLIKNLTDTNSELTDQLVGVRAEQEASEAANERLRNEMAQLSLSLALASDDVDDDDEGEDEGEDDAAAEAKAKEEEEEEAKAKAEKEEEEDHKVSSIISGGHVTCLTLFPASNSHPFVQADGGSEARHLPQLSQAWRTAGHAIIGRKVSVPMEDNDGKPLKAQKGTVVAWVSKEDRYVAADKDNGDDMTQYETVFRVQYGTSEFDEFNEQEMEGVLEFEKDAAKKKSKKRSSDNATTPVSTPSRTDRSLQPPLKRVSVRNVNNLQIDDLKSALRDRDLDVGGDMGAMKKRLLNYLKNEK